MQGRLSALVGGRIQAFPWDEWRDEFPRAQRCGLSLMEWTLDQDRLYENPLMTASGREEIKSLSLQHHVAIPSLTGDCFMQAPFWKVQGAERAARLNDLDAVIAACSDLGIQSIVVPLLDDGHVSSRDEEDLVVAVLADRATLLAQRRVAITFESDYEPAELARLIDRFPDPVFGINYDIGNSAGAGFDPRAEIRAYGNRIVGVHIKDRPRGKSTVPLGSGDAQFDVVFEELARIGYQGNFILQTARAANHDHEAVLCRYRDMTMEWLQAYPAQTHGS